MTITTQGWKKIEAHFGRPCELNERGEIVYRDGNFPVGYIATERPFHGFFVDTTGDRDQLICRVTD